MSLTSRMLRFVFNKADTKRDHGLTSPADVLRYDNLQYGEDPVWNTLDIYMPKGTDKPLPTIVSIHGGGYVYGTKEVYQYYGMRFAQRGFAFVNFNYHLAPGHQFPSQLLEINQVLEWVCANAAQFFIDTDNIIIVGDSAGAQLTSQYALLWADSAYAALFNLKVPPFRLAAIALNCGMYEVRAAGAMKGIIRDYLGSNPAQHADKLDVLSRISATYPPTYVMSAANDFLKKNCQPMAELLQSRGVPVEWKIYGDQKDKRAGHVFHVDVRYALADQCNEDEAAFFKKYLK